MATGNTGDNTQQIILQIQADTTGIEQNINDVKQLLNSLDGSGDKIFRDGDKPIQEIAAELDKATKKLKDLAAAGKQNTKEFEESKAAVVALNSEYNNLNKKVEDLNTTLKNTNMGKLEGFTQIAAGGAAAVGGIAASMQLFGIESKDAMESVAKLQALMAFAQGFDGIKQIIQGYKQWKEAAKAAREAQQALNTITGISETVTGGATKATKIFGTALKGIGIGLIVAALAYLITNFDSIKASVSKLIPGVGDLGAKFDKFKSIVVGVGSAVVQWVIAPFKTIYALFTDGMDAAIEEFKKGINVVQNYKDGFDKQEKSNAENKDKEATQKDLEATQREIERKKARGEKVLNESIRQDALERKILLKGWDSEDKVKKDREDRLDKEAGERRAKADADSKAAADKAKAKAEANKATAKAELDALKKINDDALKAIAQSTLSDRQRELDERQRTFEEQKKQYEKYHKDITAITEAFKIDEANINKKYDDIINQALAESTKVAEDEYDKKINEIKKKYQDLYKNSTPEQVTDLATAEQSQMDSVGTERDLSNNANKAKLDVARTIRENSPDDTDSPDAAYNKKAEILAAERRAEEEDYQLRLEMAKGNKDALAQLESDYLDKIASFNQHETDNKKEQAAAQAEIESKKADAIDKGMSSAAGSLETFAQVLGESTAAGKAMAVAAATISAIQGAVNSFTSMSSIPIVGPALGAVAAAASLAAGYANIKKILSVKVPGKSTAGSAAPPSMANVSPPTVASAVQGINDVRIVNDPFNKPIRAYIESEDLANDRNQSDMLNNLSTFG